MGCAAASRSASGPIRCAQASAPGRPTSSSTRLRRRHRGRAEGPAGAARPVRQRRGRRRKLAAAGRRPAALAVRALAGQERAVRGAWLRQAAGQFRRRRPDLGDRRLHAAEPAAAGAAGPSRGRRDGHAGTPAGFAAAGLEGGRGATAGRADRLGRLDRLGCGQEPAARRLDRGLRTPGRRSVAAVAADEARLQRVLPARLRRRAASGAVQRTGHCAGLRRAPAERQLQAAGLRAGRVAAGG